MLFSELVSLGGKRSVYIGESDEVGRRILQHSKNDAREFSSFVVITSKDLNLTKAHARYMENRLTELASSSGRASVENKKEPTQGSLPESDVADMAYFIEQVRLALPVLGYDILKEPFVSTSIRHDTVVTEQSSGLEIIPLSLVSKKGGLRAEAQMKEDEVLVLEGSLATKSPSYATNQYEHLRSELLSDGGLLPTDDGKHLRFTRNVAFKSPSAAAATIIGRNANGRTEWSIKNRNLSLKDYQHRQAEAAL